MREEQGFSQESFTDLYGLHRTYIGGIERGVRNPTVIIRDRIAKALKVPLRHRLTPTAKVLPNVRGRRLCRRQRLCSLGSSIARALLGLTVAERPRRVPFRATPPGCRAETRATP